ncbi:hypothetical protein Droror1_Dr00027537 [Drosera rotundifolia]
MKPFLVMNLLKIFTIILKIFFEHIQPFKSSKKKKKRSVRKQYKMDLIYMRPHLESQPYPFVDPNGGPRSLPPSALQRAPLSPSPSPPSPPSPPASSPLLLSLVSLTTSASHRHTITASTPSSPLSLSPSTSFLHSHLPPITAATHRHRSQLHPAPNSREIETAVR